MNYLIIPLYISYLFLQFSVLLFLENAFILDRHNLNEVYHVALPVVEHTSGEGRTCVQIVLTDEFEQFLATNAVLYESKFNHIHITEVVERVVWIIDVSHTTTHTSSEVATGLTQHYHTTASHILTAVVACTLDDRDGT